MILAAILSAWLQYAADGQPHARAVVSDAACPAASVDGRAVKMDERAGKSAQFDDVVCDAAVSPDAKKVRVGERSLPPPAHDPRTIVVLGDTGCRIGTLSAQACDDLAQWPFPATARAIAAVHPDVVIHVGDYLYREHACPLLAPCKDSPHGDGAPAWFADVLTPAAPLFASAPLVLARGNHEACARSGAGWFRYLDARAVSACADETDPYDVDLGDLRIVVFDSSSADDHGADAARTPFYRREFDTVRELAKRPDVRPVRARARPVPLERWFVTHRPPYVNADERAAMGDALAPFDAVLAGHIHFFAAMNVASLPPLLINGEGGASLDPNYAAFLGLTAGDLHVQGSVFGSSHFGFGVYTRAGSGWTISLRDPDGTERARCTLANRIASCRAGG